MGAVGSGKGGNRSGLATRPRPAAWSLELMGPAGSVGQPCPSSHVEPPVFPWACHSPVRKPVRSTSGTFPESVRPGSLRCWTETSDPDRGRALSHVAGHAVAEAVIQGHGHSLCARRGLRRWRALWRALWLLRPQTVQGASPGRAPAVTAVLCLAASASAAKARPRCGRWLCSRQHLEP